MCLTLLQSFSTTGLLFVLHWHQRNVQKLSRSCFVLVVPVVPFGYLVSSILSAGFTLIFLLRIESHVYEPTFTAGFDAGFCTTLRCNCFVTIPMYMVNGSR